ncbi:MAG: ArnT family glycosyltransferase, partial [Anaerolineae bacterium]
RNAPGTIPLLLIASLGIWWLGIVLGWGRWSRVWMGLIGGWIIGQTGAGASSAWLPWTVAWAAATVRWRRPLYAAVAAVMFALTILGEGSGLSIVALPIGPLLSAAAGLRRQQERPYVALRPTECALAGVVALLGLGLGAVQWMPLLFTSVAQAGNALPGLMSWGVTMGLVPIGFGMDRLMRWTAAHLRSPRMYVPAVARWAAAWSLLALLWLSAILLVIVRPDAFGPTAGTGRLADLVLSRSLIAHVTQRSAAFWIGAGLSALALIGMSALVVGDLRRRRAELRASAIYAGGILRPSAALHLPEGTVVHVAFAAPAGEARPAAIGAGTAEKLAAGPALPAGESVEEGEALHPQPLTGARQVRLTAPPGSHPWQLPDWQIAFLLLFVATIGIILFLRLFRLDSLQREIYGDIMIVRNYVTNVLAGHWPTRFDLSAGPLYHYLIAPIVILVGRDYIGLKIASVIVSLGGLAATYALCRELVDDYFALLTTFIAGVSSWLLVFSRLGNSQILSPLLTASALWLAVRFVKFNRQQDLIACAAVSALGLYVYPQLFVLPGVAFVTLLLLRQTGFSVPVRALGLFVIVALICAIPFAFIVRADPANFTVGYVGSKIRPEGGDLLSLVGHNTVKALLALHVRGDEIFRSNPPGLPHLDPLSGVLFLAGALYWLTDRERRRWTPLWLAPFLLLQVPSILAVNQPREVPSASRTLGITPIAYML